MECVVSAGRTALLVSLLLVLTGCPFAGVEFSEVSLKNFRNPGTATWLSRHASLRGYQAIEVWPVRNATGMSLPVEMEARIAADVRRLAAESGLSVNPGKDMEGKVLIVKISVMSFEEGEAFRRMLSPQGGDGAAQVTLLAEFLDKRYKRVIGELVVDDDLRGNTWGIGSPDAAEKLVERATETIAREIHANLTTE
jgi:hypothetical protein